MEKISEEERIAREILVKQGSECAISYLSAANRISQEEAEKHLNEINQTEDKSDVE